MKLTDFGKSNFIRYYALADLVIEAFMPISVLLVLNIYLNHKFKMFLENSAAVRTTIASISAKKKKESAFTRIIIILSLLTLFSHSFDLFAEMFFRIYSFLKLDNDPLALAWAYLIRQLSYFVLILFQIIGVFFLIKYDMNIKRILVKILKRISKLCMCTKT